MRLSGFHYPLWRVLFCANQGYWRQSGDFIILESEWQFTVPGISWLRAPDMLRWLGRLLVI
jgi:hypothetical protein